MPRAFAENIDEMFGRRSTRSFGPEMAAAAPAFDQSVKILWKPSKSAGNSFSFVLKRSGGTSDLVPISRRTYMSLGGSRSQGGKKGDKRERIYQRL
jgi:hypothetical protein